MGRDIVNRKQRVIDQLEKALECHEEMHEALEDAMYDRLPRDFKNAMQDLRTFIMVAMDIVKGK